MTDTALVFWDWNGTLLDDVEHTRACLNALLAEYGYPQRYSLAAYREVFGFPIRDYYVRAGFDFAKHPFPVLAERFMQLYNAGVDACPLAHGAAEVLDALAARGAAQVLLSASRQDYLAQQAGSRGVSGRFDALLGLSDIYAASKVELGRRYLAGCGADPARCVMIGDSQHDAEVARAMGIRCLLYTGGHQSRARLEASGCGVIDDLARLPALL